MSRPFNIFRGRKRWLAFIDVRVARRAFRTFSGITVARAPAQPQWIHPTRRVRHVLVRVDPTRQLHRIRRQVTTNIRIVVAMAVVVQPTFLIKVLTLKTQWVVDCSDVEPGDFAVGAVVGGPDDFTVGGGELLGCAEVVELVVIRLRFFWTEAFQ